MERFLIFPAWKCKIAYNVSCLPTAQDLTEETISPQIIINSSFPQQYGEKGGGHLVLFSLSR
jgi:hypothetical protein